MTRLLSLKHEREYIHAMGDTIDCASLIMQLSRKERLAITCYTKYLNNIESFFPPTANILLLPIHSYTYLAELEKRYEGRILKIHSTDKVTEGRIGYTDIMGLYMTAGLDYKELDKHCPIPAAAKRVKQLPVPVKPYAFIPEGGSERRYICDRKYVAKGLEIIVPPQDAFMLSYADIIDNAAEIHCHDTSWMRLIDRLTAKGNLFLHHYARKCRIPPEYYTPELRKSWKQLL